MRGEEVQFFGVQQLLPRSKHKPPQLLCFPGTHNKWIDASSSTLNNFSTTMSGELFGLLSQKSILASSIDADAPWNDDAFTQGLDHAKQPGGLLHHLFGVRALNLNGQHSQELGLSYLSGLIIGHELQDLGALAGCSIAIVGASELAHRYQLALTHFGYDAFCIDGEAATILGALAIAEKLPV